MRPFPGCVAREGNNNGRIVRHRLVRLAMKLVVAQFCRAKDHEIINESAECKWSELETRCCFHTTTSYVATSLLPLVLAKHSWAYVFVSVTI